MNQDKAIVTFITMEPVPNASMTGRSMKNLPVRRAKTSAGSISPTERATEGKGDVSLFTRLYFEYSSGRSHYVNRSGYNHSATE